MSSGGVLRIQNVTCLLQLVSNKVNCSEILADAECRALRSRQSEQCGKQREVAQLPHTVVTPEM